MFDNLFLIFVGLASLVALSDWRRALYLCLVLEVLRDPIRKLSPDQSLLVTLSVNGLWGMIFFGLINRDSRIPARLMRAFPRLRAALQLLLLALVWGGTLAVVQFPKGWLLAAVGSVSYLAPLLGIVIGYAFARNLREAERLLQVYCAVNAIALAGTYFELAGYSSPLLGGLDMEWVRYNAGDVVNLISSVYRSPDIMGLHAAMTAMFALALLTKPDQRFRGLWFFVLAHAGFCLLLCGRRKMIGMPLVFAATYLMLTLGTGGYLRRVATVSAALLLSVTAGIAFLTQEVGIPDEYGRYMSTIFTHGAERTNEVIVGSTITTFQQSGFLGVGLGTATQGARFIGSTKSWQEDGVSRVLAEFGLPGTVLVVIALGIAARVVWHSIRHMRSAPVIDHYRLALLSVVIAAGASFSVSHQVFSGDPSSAMLIMTCLGMVLGLPGLVAKRRRRTGQTMEAMRRVASVSCDSAPKATKFAQPTGEALGNGGRA